MQICLCLGNKLECLCLFLYLLQLKSVCRPLSDWDVKCRVTRPKFCFVWKTRILKHVSSSSKTVKRPCSISVHYPFVSSWAQPELFWLLRTAWDSLASEHNAWTWKAPEHSLRFVSSWVQSLNQSLSLSVVPRPAAESSIVRGIYPAGWPGWLVGWT